MSIDKQRALWPGWETVRVIGRGSFGTVYEIERNLFDMNERAALKVVSIPQNESDIEELYGNGYDEESITNSFKYHLKCIVEEYAMMRRLSDCPNIVTCDDVRYIQHDDGIGWDIHIKMELLTPLTKAQQQNIPEQTVVKLAKDLCTALVVCKEHNIVHRDIKPQNIFVSNNGIYKLGDFGIAKTVEKTMGGTKIGTYNYMAPEVYNNSPYGSAADIYSLGLVLYWLLNERRMPFLPLPPAKLSVGMDENARFRRLSGEQFAEPRNGSKQLKAIVMKACAYRIEDRYASASEMLGDLNRIGEGTMEKTGVLHNTETVSNNTTIAEDDDATASIFDIRNEQENDWDKTAIADDEDATVSLFGTQHDWEYGSDGKNGGKTEPEAGQQESAVLTESKPKCAAPSAEQEKANRESRKELEQEKAERIRKQKINKCIIALLCSLAIVILFMAWKKASSDRWETVNGQKTYIRDGERVTGWQTIDGKKYYFRSDGTVSTGWWTIDGQEYYFGPDGAMYTDWKPIEGRKYYFGKDGVLATGWQTINGKTYFFSTNGEPYTGWHTIVGKQYYFGPDGAMYTGWRTINGQKYYFSNDGVLQYD